MLSLAIASAWGGLRRSKRLTASARAISAQDESLRLGLFFAVSCGGPQNRKMEAPTPPTVAKLTVAAAATTVTPPITAAIPGAPPIADICNSATVDPFPIAPPAARADDDIHVAAYVPATGPVEEKPIEDRAQLPRYASDAIITIVDGCHFLLQASYDPYFILESVGRGSTART